MIRVISMRSPVCPPVVAGAAFAQASYPVRLVRVIVPFAAGTSPEVVIRIVAPHVPVSPTFPIRIPVQIEPPGLR